jgi:hypothetical protein
MIGMNGRTDGPVQRLTAPLPERDLSPGGGDIEIGFDSQLFADDHLVSFKAAVHRRLNRPLKSREPFLVADREWEGGSILYSCVVEDGDEYRLYYKAKRWAEPEVEPYSNTPICLARSTDAIGFHKDPFGGAAVPNTNIVINDVIDDFTVHLDDGDPQRRYKLLSSRWNWREGLTPAWSADGIQWTWGRDHAVRHFGDRCSYWYDPIRKVHIAWSRNQPLYRGRIIVHAESDDFESWSDPRIAIMPDRLDHPEVQIYGGYGFWYRSIYFAYLEIYHVEHQRLNTELACSRDGLTWHRLCEHDVFLPNGDHGDFDAYWVVPTFNPPILRDGRLLIHYGGRPDPHRTAGFQHVPPGMGGALALSELREDGFVSLDATGVEAVVETRPLNLPERPRFLDVNICPFNTRPGYDPMDAVVEVFHGSGYCLSAHRIHGDPDRVWYRIPLDPVHPDRVRLRFRLRNARLYSFRFQV